MGLRPAIDPDWFKPSLSVIRNIAGLASIDPPAQRADGVRIATGLAQAFQHINLDRNPHQTRAALAAALTEFVQA